KQFHYRIGANKITTEGGKSLANAIKKILLSGFLKLFLHNLLHSLAFNSITTEGGKSLAEAMKHNNGINIFWLTKNELDDEAAESFAEMVKVNKRLGHL
ncbi:hypothetical protein E2320_002039, partial [Naja naja]